MFQSCIWAARSAALTAALLVFTAVPALAAPHGGGHGGGRGGVAHGVAHTGGFHGGVAHTGGFRGGVAHTGGFRGGNYYRGNVGRGYVGNRGYYGYGGGYYGWPYWGGYNNNYYAWPYSTDYYYPNDSVNYGTLPATSYYYNPSIDIPPSNYETANNKLTATIGIQVPPTAQVWFDGMLTTETGAWRTFVTPPLESDKAFYYTVRAQWNDNGHMVDQTRRITVRGGQETDVDFTRP